MNEQERKSMIEQMLANPAFEDVMGGVEARAIEECIYAKTDKDRESAAYKVQAVRAFRQDCQSAIDSAPVRKGVVA